jgi:hypothetical protein
MYVPVPEDRREAVRQFVSTLRQFWLTNFRAELSQRTVAETARIRLQSVGEIWTGKIGLPPAKLRALLGEETRQGTVEVCTGYLTAYGRLYTDDDGLKWIERWATAPAGPDSEGVLERSTRAAMREANRLVGRDSAELFLSDLYVPRRLAGHRELRTEADLQARCGTASVTVIVGEPGTGKTSALWRLTDRLRQSGGRRAWLIAAGEIESVVPIADIAAALRSASSDRKPPVLLVDTVDLLLRSDDLPPVLDELIRSCSAAGAALVMTCRPREFEVLRRHAGEYELARLQLGPYHDDELPVAVENHAKHFIDRRFDPSPIAQAVLTAVARGLPIAQICQVPLTLRMLFELHQLEHTGDQPLETEIDVTDLFDKYWRLRVRTDARTNHTGPAPDLSVAAETLAVVMLAAGTPRVGGDAARVLERVEGLLDDLDALTRRSVVHELGGGLREFFHQTFFEYAVARAIVALGAAALDALVARTLARPDDGFLGAVTQQALVYACRTVHDAAVADEPFATLLDCSDNRVQQIAVAAYAQARQRGPRTTAAGHRLLAAAGKGMARRFLIYVARIRHDDPDAVIKDLRLVWQHHDDVHVRAEVFGALRSLALVRPIPVLDVVTEPGAPYLAWYLGLTPPAAQLRRRPVIELLGELAREDPQWCADSLEKVARAAVRDDGAQDGVVAVLTVAAESGLRADRLRSLLAVIPADVRNDPSGANELGLVVAAIARQIWLAEGTDPVTVAEDLAGHASSSSSAEDPAGHVESPSSLAPGDGWTPPDWLAGPARLRALAELACDQDPASADRLTSILVSTGDRQARTEVGNHFLKHLIGGRHRPRLPGEPEPADTTATKAARRRCVEALRSPEPAPSQGRSEKALWRDALYAGTLPPPEVAGIVAQVVRGDTEPGWLDVDQLAALVVPAALGDLPGAKIALTAWSGRGDPSRVRKIVMPRLEHLAPDFPAAFDYLLAEAAATTDGAFLDGALTKLAHRRIPLPDDFAQRVTPVVHALLASKVPGTVRHGFAIAARVYHGRIVEPKTIVAALAIRDKNALTAVLNLVGASLEHDPERWAPPDDFARLDHALEALEPPGVAPDPALGRRAYEYRRTLICHSGSLTPATFDRVRKLILGPGDPALLEPLGLLLSRLVPVDPDAAAALLIDTSAAIERITVAETTNSWRSRRAFRLRHPVRTVLAALPYGTWKRAVTALADGDAHVFTVAIEVSIREGSDDMVAHLRRLVAERDLRDDRVESMLRTATTRRQRITGAFSTWPELQDLWLTAALPPRSRNRP